VKRLVALVGLAAIASGCRGMPQRPSRGAFAEGLASYYGKGFDGWATASGEVFDQDDFTAAHRGLKFGTCVLVEHVKNGRRVKVRVNDRGPALESRLIDLSEAAARELEMIETGVARVRLYGCN
jgi:rare lipoprotein A